jgi:hypothetical protein
MTMRIKMLVPRRSEDGLSIMTPAGSPYTVNDPFGEHMVRAGFADDIDGELVPRVVASTVRRLAAVAHLHICNSFAKSQVAIGPAAVVSLTPTAIATAVRLAWVDLNKLRGATTDNAGYAVGARTVNLAAAGTGVVYAGDEVRFGAHVNTHIIGGGDADVSGGGALQVVGGLTEAIAAAATSITIERRGVFGRISLNSDNDVEGLVTSQDERSADAKVRLGETVMLVSDDDVAITQVHVSSPTSVAADAHRLEAHFGTY